MCDCDSFLRGLRPCINPSNNPQSVLATNPSLPRLQRERSDLQPCSGDIGAGLSVPRPVVRDHTAPPGLAVHLGSRGAGSARRAPQVRQVPRGFPPLPQPGASRPQRSAGAERRSLGHRAGGVASRRAVEADFLGGLSGATMAFGKSHRDPYATSVGHLIGKEPQGTTKPAGVGGPWELCSLDSILDCWGPSWTKLEKMLPSPPQLSHAATCVLPPAEAGHLSFFGSLMLEPL